MKSTPNKTLTGVPNIAGLWPLLVFLLLSLLLYGNTLSNDYCLDDTIVITENTFTKDGISGIPDIFTYESFTGFFGKEKQLVSGGRYRPFSIATFALEYQFLGLNAAFSHFVNIVLYGLTGYFIFLLILLLLPQQVQSKWYQSISFLVAALFMFHPVHTEVVANIKGRDEILALLFGILSFWQVLLYDKNRKLRNLVFSSFFLLLALFSKEHALVFAVLIPLSLIMFRRTGTKQFLTVALWLVVPSIIFLSVRQVILGNVLQIPVTELMNNSFIGATSAQHFATVFYVLLKYLQLLVFPHPLTYDYYPYHITLTDWENLIPVISIIIYSAILIASIIYFRRQPLITFSVLLFLLPLLPVTNIFFPIGTFLSERFLYIPSLGFCILGGFFLYKGLKAPKRILKTGTWIIISVFAVFFGWKTISRNAVWENDLTLFTTDVKISHNSAKGNCAAGGILFDHYKNFTDTVVRNEMIKPAIQYLENAITIHPKYEDAWLLLGNTYTLFPDSIPKALFCYEQILSFSSGNTKAIQNIEYLTLIEKQPARKADLLERVLQYKPDSYHILSQLGNTWGKELQNLDKAAYYLEKAIEVNPQGKEAMRDLGVAYAMLNNFRKSAEVLEKAVRLDSTDANTWVNLGLTYTHLREVQKAGICFEKAKLLQSAGAN